MILVLAVGGFWGWGAYRTMERRALEAQIEPYEVEWASIVEEAKPWLVELDAVMNDAGPAVRQSCGALEGAIEVVHRPVLQALARGERFADVGAPYWLSSDAYRARAGSVGPGMSVDNHRRRNEETRAALGRACVAVLETEQAQSPTMQGPTRFDGGQVVGWLRVVCLGPRAVVCQAPLSSQPMFAVAVKQKRSSRQASANAMALQQSAQGDYWKAVETVLAEIGPGLTLVERSP